MFFSVETRIQLDTEKEENRMLKDQLNNIQVRYWVLINFKGMFSRYYMHC